LIPLSVYEHTRSIKPSDQIVLYLSGLLILNLLQVVIGIHHEHQRAISTFSWLNIGFEALLLGVEGQSKRSILASPHNKLPPEERVGILNSSYFWWINSFLFQGYQNGPSVAGLPPVDRKIQSAPLKSAILRNWDQRGIPNARFLQIIADCF
jgi:ATP-binding cassette subfamily C (CFTR/MRP) protein 1